MCHKCVEIDKRIAHLNEVAGRLADTQTLQGLHSLIADLDARKAALHPERH